MKCITYLLESKALVFMSSNRFLGTAISRGFQNVEELREWEKENPEAEPIVEVLELEDNDPLVKQVRDHNGEFNELQYDPDTKTISIYNSAYLDRLKLDKIAELRLACNEEILSEYDMYDQINIEGRRAGYTDADRIKMNDFITEKVAKYRELKSTVLKKQKENTIAAVVW